MVYLKQTLHSYDENGEPLVYAEIAGLSSDSKPTAGIVSGSLFTEVDTGKRFVFDGLSDTAAWTELVVLTSTGGGE